MEEMAENVAKITAWASRGSLRGFRIEAGARLADSEYGVMREGDTLVFYRTHKEGGFLGIGRKTVREPVMKIVERTAGIVKIAPEPRDPEFVDFLASRLQQH